VTPAGIWSIFSVPAGVSSLAGIVSAPNNMAVKMAEDDEDVDNISGEPEVIEISNIFRWTMKTKQAKRLRLEEVTDVFEWDSSVMNILLYCPSSYTSI